MMPTPIQELERRITEHGSRLGRVDRDLINIMDRITYHGHKEIGIGTDVYSEPVDLSGLPIHDIISLHSSTGVEDQVVGINATPALALLTPSDNPGVAKALLKTTAAGLLTLQDLNVTNRVGIGVAAPAAKLEVEVATATEIAQINKAAGSQSANILENRDSSDNVLSGVDSDGLIFSYGSADNTNFITGGAGNASITGTQNIFIGNLAGENTTTGARNIALGNQALEANTEGSDNFALGRQSLEANLVGIHNVAIGDQALQTNLGSDNIGIGWKALRLNSSGSTNTAVGRQALATTTVTDRSTAVGYQALVSQNTGGLNTAIGYQSLSGVTTGTKNAALGIETGEGVTTGSSNIFIGYRAGQSAPNATANTLMIHNDSTLTPLIYGEFNNDFIRLYAATAITNTVHDVLHLSHVTSDSPILVNFGVGLKFQLESTTSNDQDAARIAALWLEPTHAILASALIFQTRTAGGALAEQVRIDDVGNVGIGTTSPGYELDVSGTVRASGAIITGFSVAGIVKNSSAGELSGGNSIDISDDTNLAVTAPITLTDDTIGLDETLVDHGNLAGLADDDHAQYIFNSPASDARNVIQPANEAVKGLIIKGAVAQIDNLFEIQNSAGTALDVIDAAGNVGIGTASPGHELDVSGTVRATGAIISTFSVAGIVKNTAAGVLSGGNSIDISDDTNLAVTAPITLTGDTIGLGTIDISANTNLAVTAPITLTGDTIGLGTVDISSNTNLAVTAPIVLTGDTLSLSQIDISTGTNLAVTAPITLTGDTIGLGTVDISANTNLSATAPVTLTGDVIGLNQIDISADTNLAVTAPITLTGDTIGLGTVDISTNTNLAVTAPITLTGDTIGLDQSSVDHGSLAGLSDDDHSQYILKAPTSDTRNVIQPASAIVKALVIKGAVSQSDNLTEWQNSSATALAVVDENGNVGIGTDSPGVPLHVVTSEASSPAWVTADTLVLERAGTLRLQLHTGPTDEAGIWFTDTVRGQGRLNYNHNLDSMTLHTSALVRMTIDNSGNVGIGTTSPLQRLEVGDANPSYTPVLTAGEAILLGGSTAGRLYIEGSTQADIVLDDSGGVANDQVFQFVNTSGFTKWRILNDAGTIKKDNVISANMTSGLIGMGIAVAGAPLHIYNSSSEILRLANSNAAGSPYLSFYQGTVRRAYIQLNDSSNDLRVVSEAGEFSIWTGTGSVTEKLTVEAGGDVGIGTNIPSTRLYVKEAGTVGSPGVTSRYVAVFQRSSSAGEDCAISVVAGNTAISSIGFGDTDDVDIGEIRYVHNGNLMSFWVGSLEKMRLETNGALYVNDTSNVNMDIGLTISQGNADNEILSLKSSDVTHGITSFAETDTYGTLQKVDATLGGLRLAGLSESTRSMYLFGVHTTDTTTKTTSSVGSILLSAAKKSGTSYITPGSNANLVVIRANQTTRWIVDSEGDIFYGGSDDGTITDDHDDALLLSGFRAVMSPEESPAHRRFKGFLSNAEDILIKQGVLTAPLKQGGLVSDTGLKSLLIDAIVQLNGKINTLEERLNYGNG